MAKVEVVEEVVITKTIVVSFTKEEAKELCHILEGTSSLIRFYEGLRYALVSLGCVR